MSEDSVKQHDFSQETQKAIEESNSLIKVNQILIVRSHQVIFKNL
jgi:hypothetical protein